MWFLLDAAACAVLYKIILAKSWQDMAKPQEMQEVLLSFVSIPWPCFLRLGCSTCSAVCRSPPEEACRQFCHVDASQHDASASFPITSTHTVVQQRPADGDQGP